MSKDKVKFKSAQREFYKSNKHKYNENTANTIKNRKKKSKSVNKQDKLVSQSSSVISVYKRQTVLPLSPDRSWLFPQNRFMNPSDQNYDDVLSRCYQGFTLQPKDRFTNTFHETFYNAFIDLEDRSMFQFDFTQPAGLNTKIAKTFVTRCVVGTAGITYKYLGLRMFSYPWDENEFGVTTSMVDIKKLNDQLISHTKKLLKNHCNTRIGYENDSSVGSCDYNLTLINRCYPEDSKVVSKLKDEPLFKLDKTTVSWHADSSLEHFSSIAVYHCEKSDTTTQVIADKRNRKGKKDESACMRSDVRDSSDVNSWKIALKVHPNAEGPTAASFNKQVSVNSDVQAPPICVPLPNQSAYFLLDDFNHHHQHSVLVGSTHRYGSTHRVSRVDGHSYQWIKARCQAALQSSVMSSKQLRNDQHTLNDLEFEWIRQYFIQGTKHHELHIWWHQPIQILLQFWLKLQQKTIASIIALEDAAGDFNSTQAVLLSNKSDIEQKKLKKKLSKRKSRLVSVDLKSYDVMIEYLNERSEKRIGWLARELDPIFNKITREYRPMTVPFPSLESSHSNDIEANTDIHDDADMNKLTHSLMVGNDFSCLIQNINRWKIQFETKAKT